MRWSKRQPGRRAFILLEVVIAMSFFSVAAVGYIVALHQVGRLATEATARTTITRIIDSAMLDALATPRLEVGETKKEVGELGDDARMVVTTTIEELELQNQTEVSLQEMFSIKIDVEWFDGSEWQERSAETWRYARMYVR